MNRHSMPLVLAVLLGFSRVLDANEPQLAHLVFFTLADDTPDHREQLVTVGSEPRAGLDRGPRQEVDSDQHEKRGPSSV